MLDRIPLELADIIIQYTVLLRTQKELSESTNDTILTIENIRALYSLRLVSKEICRRVDFVFLHLLKKYRVVLYKTSRIFNYRTCMYQCIGFPDCIQFKNVARLKSKYVKYKHEEQHILRRCGSFGYCS